MPPIEIGNTWAEEHLGKKLNSMLDWKCLTSKSQVKERI